MRTKWAKGFFVGIDYGTTKSAIATIEAGGAPQLRNLGADNPSMPSSVKLSKYSTGNPPRFRIDRVGWWAKYADVKTNDTSCVFERSKLDIGKDGFKGYGPQNCNKNYDQVTPEDIAAIIIKRLKNSIESKQSIEKRNVKTKIKAATITVPASWNPIQREATKYAGYLAGFEDVELILEPVAALLTIGASF